MRNCVPSLLVPTRGAARHRKSLRCGHLAVLPTVAVLVIFATASAFPAKTSQTKEKKPPALHWDPPNVDGLVPSLSATPPCSLTDVLKLAGERATELVTHLQNFNAQERIRYSQTDELGMPEVVRDAKFDYLVDFGEISAVPKVHETRTPLASPADASLGATADRGLAILALIFYPALQDDYDMRCEGYSQWNGQPAWVIYFRQSKAKHVRTFGIRTSAQTYPISLKGRAWIAADSGQVMHLETNMMHGIAAIGLQGGAVSVDYAPVKFHTQDVEIWLPQSAVAYSDYGRRRMIFGHTFSDFQLFSVQTQQVIEKPKTP